MELANKLLMSPVVVEPRRSRIKVDSNTLSILATALAGVFLIAALVFYNLNQVPRSEVDRIYKNAGAAVKRTFYKQ